MSVNHHRLIAFHDDPEEWARSLVGAFRAPDLFIAVVHDDHPYTPTHATEVSLEEPVYEAAH
jgi:hypothetical protein